MAETIQMPKLGFDMSEGTLVRWVIQEGDPVEKGAVLAEIETDKATVEVESNFSGVVARQLVAAGDIVPVGTPIAIVAAPGEKVEEIELPAPQPADANLAGEAGQPTRAEAPGKEVPSPISAVESEGARLPAGVRASPLARRMAADLGVPLAKVKGTGEDGRIVVKDVRSYMTSPAIKAETGAVKAAPPIEEIVSPEAGRAVRAVEGPAKPAKPLVPLAPLPSSEIPGDATIEMSRLRAAIGRRMTESKQQVPHFYVTHEYDLDALMALRKQTNEMLPEEMKLSVNDFIIKAAAVALRQFSNLNAFLDGARVIRHGSVHIGVAVAVEGGLLTVVCRDADRKPLRQIGAEVRIMAARAREGKVRPDDIEGSTFSVSNLGMYDVDEFSAIINPPEAAILAVSSARQVPVVRDGQIVVGWRMKATISVDHRVSDGAEAARFMQALAPYLEQPLRLML